VEETMGVSGTVSAGNTAESLAGVDRDAFVADVKAFELVSTEPSVAEETDAILDEENTFDVSRKEFEELKDAFIRLIDRIAKYNEGSPHKL
jgi:hypothetical protein